MRADHILKTQEKINVHIHSQVCQITRAIIEENNNGKYAYIKYMYNEDPVILDMITQRLQEKFVDSIITIQDDPMYKKSTIFTVNWSDTTTTINVSHLTPLTIS